MLNSILDYNASGVSNLMTAEEPAKTVQPHGRGELAARPWDFHRPEASLWWLVPAKEWPGFAMASLSFPTGSSTLVPPAPDSYAAGPATFCAPAGTFRRLEHQNLLRGRF
jgi:hypothetical protein